MSKILISWIAIENDFIKGKGEVNPYGPNVSIHQLFYDYDYHLLLSSGSKQSEDVRFDFLVNYLQTKFSHQIQTNYMDIMDVINLKEIQAKVDNLLLNNRSNEMEIFISPGTPTMQVAWYFSHLSLGLNTKLFQLRPGKFTKSGQSEKIYVDIEKSPFTSTIVIKEDANEYDEIKDIKITKSIKPLYDVALKVANTDHVTTLILGETGTGKEYLAKFIHEKSHRSKGPFVAVNCAAIPTELIESELFGHVKGAFTSATAERKGKFEDANNGTIFLDEVADLSPSAQAKLLRVLQERKLTKIGSNKLEPLNIRVIAATNKNLEELCKEGKYRWDLFFRLNIVELTVLPLRDRGKKEIEEIMNFLSKKKAWIFNRPILKFNEDALQVILNYPFPGNIRELENLLERQYAICNVDVALKDLPPKIINPPSEYSLKLVDVENNHIKKVYEMCNRNGQEACRVLGIRSFTTLKTKLNIIYGNKN